MSKRKQQKKIKEECWALDYYLILWLNEHLKVFKEDAIDNVDLEFYKFNYKGEEYTELQIIDKLIEVTDFLLKSEPYGEPKELSIQDIKYINARKDEMYDLLKLVHWQLWW